ncbi:MAG: SAF domain-containing protein [Actinomycetota bacterium]
MSTFLRRCRHALWRLYRRPLLFSVAAIALGAATFLTTGALADRAPTAAVIVATRDVAAGSPIGPDDVRLEHRPVDGVPSDALDEVPSGRVALVGLAAEEVVLDRRLAPGGVGPVSSLLPTDASGVSLPAGSLPAGIAVGDRVDLLLVVPGSTETISAAAPIIGIDERTVTVAVPAAGAPAVVEALTLGQLVAVLAPSW